MSNYYTSAEARYEQNKWRSNRYGASTKEKDDIVARKNAEKEEERRRREAEREAERRRKEAEREAERRRKEAERQAQREAERIRREEEREAGLFIKKHWTQCIAVKRPLYGITLVIICLNNAVKKCLVCYNVKNSTVG